MPRGNYFPTPLWALIFNIIFFGGIILIAMYLAQSNPKPSPEQEYDRYLENQSSEVQAELESIEYPRED